MISFGIFLYQEKSQLQQQIWLRYFWFLHNSEKHVRLCWITSIANDQQITQRYLPADIYFNGYFRLSELPCNSYDPVLNRKYLLECIKWFLSCCDSIDGCKKDTSDVDHITSNLNVLNMNKSNTSLVADQVLIESLYIICNLEDVHPLYRYLQLPERLKR